MSALLKKLTSTTSGAGLLALAATLLPAAHAARHAAAPHKAAPLRASPAAAKGRASAPAAHLAATAHKGAARRTAELPHTERQRATSTRKPEPARSKRHSEAPAYVALSTVANGRSLRSTAAPKQRPGNTDAQASQSAQDRVHAWYRAQHPDTLLAATPARDTPAVVKQVANVPAPEKPTPQSIVSKAEPQTSLPKTTAADPERNSEQPQQPVRTVAPTKPTHSTADDDAAFAEASNLPSTAPTEREPAPFIHGDLLGSGPAQSPAQRQAILTPPASVPAITHIDPRGDAEVLSSTPASTTAKNQPAPVFRSPAPGAVAVTAKKLKPDAANADSAAQQLAENDDSAPKRVVTLAPTATRTDALAKAALVPSPAGGYDVDLSGGPLVKVNLYDSSGKLILLPAMKGSHEILVHQNQMALADGLDRVEDDNQLADMRRLKLLVALPDDEGMYPDGRLPLNRRFARPWTVRFLNDLSRAHNARFHTSLIITSAVRTVAFQRRLVLTNGNAAPPTGDVASPHLYGQAVDIAKHGMSMTELAWMRSYLTPIETSGKIDVEEEFQQACFHLSVYRRYLGLPTPKYSPAPEVVAPSRTLEQVRTTPTRHRRIPTALLATGLR